MSRAVRAMQHHIIFEVPLLTKNTRNPEQRWSMKNSITRLSTLNTLLTELTSSMRTGLKNKESGYTKNSCIECCFINPKRPLSCKRTENSHRSQLDASDCQAVVFFNRWRQNVLQRISIFRAFTGHNRLWELYLMNI